MSKEIGEKISGYNLMDTLLERMTVVVVGGVARPTCYKAFRKGGTTPTLRQILDHAEAIIEQHEANIALLYEQRDGGGLVQPPPG